jgi:hypothetical protein
VPIGAAPRDPVHVLKILLVIAAITGNIAIAPRRPAGRNLIGVKDKNIRLDRQVAGVIDRDVVIDLTGVAPVAVGPV